MMPTATGPAPSNVDLCATVLDWLAPRRSPNTIYSYRQSYVALLRAVDIPLRDVTTDQLDRWLRRPRRNGADPSPATHKRELAALRVLFKYLVSRGLIAHDPTVLLLEDAPKIHNEQPKPIELKLWRKVWMSDLDDSARVLLGFGMFVGLRRAEIASLVPAQIIDDPPRLVGVKRKGGKRQGFHYGSCLDLYEAKLPEWIGDRNLFTDSLNRLMESRAERPALLPFADERTERCVTRTVHTVAEGTVNPDLCGKRLVRILEGCGLDGRAFTLHQLRHSFCTNLCGIGVPIEVVSQLAGHSSLDITRRYVELGEDPLARFLTDRADGLPQVNRWGH